MTMMLAPSKENLARVRQERQEAPAAADTGGASSAAAGS
jgi:hypothetical protein